MSQSAFIEEVPDEQHESSGGELEDATVEDVLAPGSSAGKKKKKKKSKAAKALSAFQMKASVSQPLVDEVLKRVQAEVGPSHPEANEQSVREALQQLKVNDYLEGKSGLGGKNKKDMGDYKFWSTQPVSKLGEAPPQEDGYIDPALPRNEVRQEPYPLPKDFEWVAVDMTNQAELTELYELLSANYVEDDGATFRFKYSAEFLQWALMPPGWHKEWHVGVRVKSNRKLVAFIGGAPVTLRVRNAQFKSVEINFLVVHKKLRGKRLAPVLIKEVTRQCNLKGIFQAIYTAGVFLPTPVSICRYYHRLLNIPKLVEVGFTGMKPGMTVARMVRLFKLPSAPALATRGLREMEERDIPEVRALYNQYMKRFGMIAVYSAEDLKHLFLSGLGRGQVKQGRREGQVIWSYVVEDPNTQKISDFFSFYTLPSTILGNARYNVLDAAYLWNYGTTVALQNGADEDGRLKRRLNELVSDALVIAELAKFDVFNAMTLMDNDMFLSDLKFGQGDGLLNFYLYNWRTSSLSGVDAVGEYPKGRGIGIVML
ncbi:Myristoyl-CoA:protein N-myristoyltransferase, N-terminal domain-containing protein [Auriculariales sp. MPI-PUGE-AT-0066]|nr:Myristoyl-CoA:protein N-myristoyltransferase, N-terminal domain-containing protein [Auriculariales sp. MPI-PUGE-AT-0066]